MTKKIFQATIRGRAVPGESSFSALKPAAPFITKWFTKAMLDLNEGRNLDHYPLISFDGKNADPEGCSGIRKIARIDADGVTVEVGIRKTYGRDEEWADEQMEVAQGCLPYIQGSEWADDDDGWDMTLAFEVTVPWIWKDDEDPEDTRPHAGVHEAIGLMAADCIKRAKAELKSIEGRLRSSSRDLDAIGHDEEEEADDDNIWGSEEEDKR